MNTVISSTNRNTRKYPTKVTELKNTITELKNILGRYNSSLDESKVVIQSNENSSRRNRKKE